MHLHAGHAAFGERHGEQILQTRGSGADDDDLVLEHGGIDQRRLALEDLVLGVEEVVEAVVRVGDLAVLHDRPGVADEHSLAVGVRPVQARNHGRHERRRRGPDAQRRAIPADRVARHGPGQHHRGEGERWHAHFAHAHERSRAAHGTVRVVDREVVPHRRRGVGQFVVGQDDAGPGFERRVGRERLAGPQPFGAPAAHLRRFVCRDVGDEHHVAGARRRCRQRAIGLGPAPVRVADAEGPLLPLGEQHVVHDDPGWGAGQVVDERRMHQARPWPPAHLRLEAPDAAVVDAHQHDVAARRQGVGRQAHAVVVRLELDRPGKRRPACGPRQGGRRGANRASDQDPAWPTRHHELRGAYRLHEDAERRRMAP